jgi:hypothetical protein
MAKKVWTRKTPQQRRAEAEQLQERIAAQVQELTSGEGWARFLAASTGFHRYSLNNVLLILSQRPDATRVAGYRAWQKRGRQVRDGEKHIKIYGYSVKRIKAPDDDPDVEEQQFVYYPIRRVFDISQTDPIDPTAEVPNIAPRLRGGDEAGIFDATTVWLAEQGWTVTRQHLNGEDGISIFDGSRRVLIHDELEPAHEALTVLHETAHVLLHAGASDYQQHRGIYETEAESVAYVVARVLGLDTSVNSIGYIAGWTLGDTTTVKATAERVLATVRTILDGITQQDDPASDGGEG